MIKKFKYAFCILGFFVCAYSCIDSTYDIDKLNKDSVFPIPPVPMGNIEKIWVNTLPDVNEPPYGSGGKDKAIKLKTLKNFFNGGIIDKFFYEGATRNVVLETKTDVDIAGRTSVLKVEVYIRVVNNKNMVIEQMKIPTQYLTQGKNQEMNIIFPAGNFSYMQDARDLELIFIIQADSLRLTEKDYIYIKNLVLKSGGVHFEF